MNETPNLDTRLQDLAERYFRYLKDQLYDPQPKVDGYGKEKQRQDMTNLLRDLARDATDLILNRDEPDQDSFVLIRLNEEHEGLCPKCHTPLEATIYFGSESVTPSWHSGNNCWEYTAEGGDTYIEQFICPSCNWFISYVEPHEDEP